MLAVLALLAAGLFTGAAVYINLVEHPARMELPDAAALAQWKPAYRRGALMQASLALAGFALGLAAWWLSGRDWRLLAGGVAMLANWPYTLLAINPVNTRLKATHDAEAALATRALLERWNRLHAGRSALGALAVVLFTWSICCP